MNRRVGSRNGDADSQPWSGAASQEARAVDPTPAGGADEAQRSSGKVSQIKKEVEYGVYIVDPGKVAQAMIDKAADDRIPGKHEGNKMPFETECHIRALHYEGLSGSEISEITGVSEGVVFKAIRRHHRPAIVSNVVPEHVAMFRGKVAA